METKLSPLSRLKNLLKADQKEIYHVYVYALFNGLVNLSLPLGIQAIIHLIQGGEISYSWAVLVAFVIMGVAFSGILQFLQLRIVENLSQKIFSRASFEFAYRIPKMKTNALDNYYAPELANRFFDTLTLQKGLPKILMDFSLSIFQILVGLILLSLYHSFFIIYGIVLIVLIYVIIAITGPRGMHTSMKESTYKYKMAFWIEEIARTKLSFKLTDTANYRLDQCNRHAEKYLDSRESHFKILASQFGYLIAFKVLITAGLLIIGSVLVFNQEMNIGQFVAAEIVIIIIIASVEKLIRTLETVYDVLTALEKIGYVTDMPLDKEDGLFLDEKLSDISISLTDVTYNNPQSSEHNIEKLSFHLPAKTSLYIDGAASSGKHTLLGIIGGIIELDSGSVNFGPFALSSLDKNNLRSKIGYVIGNKEIFQASIMDNILLGRENVSLNDIKEALHTVELIEYIFSLPMGLHTIIDPDGKNISKSTIDKILLARAIVTKPELLIMDSPLYHIEAEEKERIINSLCSKDKPWSIILISVDGRWRKAIKSNLLLDKGKIVNTNLEVIKNNRNA